MLQRKQDMDSLRAHPLYIDDDSDTTLVNLRSVDVGFNPNNLVNFRLNLPPSTYPTVKLRTVLPEVLARVAAVPGVQRAADFPVPVGAS